MTYTVQNRNSFPPVEIKCGQCGQPFTTTAKTVTRSPCCKRSVRIPARLRLAPPGQAVATATPQLAATRYADTPAPRIKPRSVAPRPVSMPAVAVPEPEPDPDDDSDIRNQTYDAIKRAVVDKQAQQIAALPEVIQVIERTINEVMPDEPALRYQTGFAANGMMTLRLWAEQEQLIMPKIAQQVVPAVEAVARQIKAFKTEKVQRCEWPDCGARRYVDTPELYRVTSPAMNRAILLCHRHALMEASIPGAELVVAK